MEILDVPNLDCMESDELLELADIFSRLAQYAANKASAQTYRKAGNIKLALIQEKLCDAIYQKLPKEYQW